MGSNNSDLQTMERQIRQLQAQLNRSRELPGDMMSRILAAERSRQMGRTRRSLFTTPGISSMQSLLREY